MESQPIQKNANDMVHIDAIRKLERHREVWSKNLVLRTAYNSYYQRIINWLPQNASTVLELGGGIGNFKETFPQIITTDIVRLPWVDVVMDAQRMPVVSGTIDAIVMVDVLHHIEAPIEFFQEALRCLRPGGRLLIVDMYISFFSNIILKLLHPEPVNMNEDFWKKNKISGEAKDPWDANQAMATKFFWKELDTFEKRFPQLQVKNRETFDWCWPSTGGFSYPAIFPAFIRHWLPAISTWKIPNGLGAFRSFVALERCTEKII